MKLDAGTPSPHVTVLPFGPSQRTDGGDWCSFAAGFSVKCAHCGCVSTAYMPFLTKNPKWIAKTVRQHNRCVPKN